MEQKTVAIVQSNYIPWKGYFDLIAQADEFILYDDAKYTKNDWRNRNQIKTPQGRLWLTISVDYKFSRQLTIRQTKIADPGWVERHFGLLREKYGGTRGFEIFGERFELLYKEATSPWLSAVNESFIRAICDMLGIRTQITSSSDYELEGGPVERIIGLCQQTGATTYLSGPSARNYLDESLFADAGIELRYIDYQGYREYPQRHPPFEHAVSIVDLLFNTGEEARSHLLTAME